MNDAVKITEQRSTEVEIAPPQEMPKILDEIPALKIEVPNNQKDEVMQHEEAAKPVEQPKVDQQKSQHEETPPSNLRPKVCLKQFQEESDSFKMTKKVLSHALRKPSGLSNRKGLPQKYNPSKIIVDEEYLLTIN